jgi:hypothetical protein
MEITRIAVDDVRSRLDRGEALVTVDARSDVSEIPRGRAIVTFCT